MQATNNQLFSAGFRRAWRVIHTAPPTPFTPPVNSLPPLTPNFQKSYILQPACPLFTRIPPELRTRIFEFALTEYDDLDNPYHKDAFYYRPGYHYRKRIDTALLLTCRLIYLEAHLIPLSINEHVFYFERGPTGRKPWSQNPRSYFPSLTPEQRDAVSHVHFFMQQYLLEGSWESNSFASLTRVPEMHPRKITITIRHTDWWFWEDDEPLGIDPRLPYRVRKHEMLGSDTDDAGGEGRRDRKAARDETAFAWGNQFKNLRGLNEVVIELETVQRKKAELDGIVRRAREWRFDLADGRTLVREEKNTRSYTWVGSSKFDALATPRRPTVQQQLPPLHAHAFAQEIVPGFLAYAPPPTNGLGIDGPGNALTPATPPPPTNGPAGPNEGDNANVAPTLTTTTTTIATPTPPAAPVPAGLAMYVVVMRWCARTVAEEARASS